MTLNLLQPHSFHFRIASDKAQLPYIYLHWRKQLFLLSNVVNKQIFANLLTVQLIYFELGGTNISGTLQITFCDGQLTERISSLAKK